MANWREDPSLKTAETPASAPSSWRDDPSIKPKASQQPPMEYPGSTWYNPTTWTAADNPLANTVGTKGSATDAFIRGAVNSATLNQAGRISDAVTGNDWAKDTAYASQQHPIAAGAGTLAGAMPAGAMSVGKSVLGTVGRSAVMGGVQGAGEKFDTPEDLLRNMGTGAAINATIGGIAHGLTSAGLTAWAKRMGMTKEELLASNAPAKLSKEEALRIYGEAGDPGNSTTWDAMKLAGGGLANAAGGSVKPIVGATVGGFTGQKAGEGLEYVGVGSPELTRDMRQTGMLIGGGGGAYAAKDRLREGTTALAETLGVTGSKLLTSLPKTSTTVGGAITPSLVETMKTPTTAAESNRWLHNIFSGQPLGSVPPSFGM